MVNNSYEYNYLMDITSIISKKVKAARTSAGLTQKELAERCGITIHAVADIEAGRRKPSLDLLFAMGSALRVNSSDLIDTGEMPLPLPVSPRKAIEKFLNIPDFVVEIAAKIGPKHPAWDMVRGRLEDAETQVDEMAKQSHRA